VKDETSGVSEGYLAKASAGYVEVPEGPTCGNCEYIKDGICIHPPEVLKGGGLARFNFKVDPVKGCCTFWEANDESKEAAIDFAHDLADKLESD
jgi:hypothetical protein